MDAPFLLRAELRGHVEDVSSAGARPQAGRPGSRSAQRRHEHIHAHTPCALLLQVRGCLSCELGVVTASRDKTVRVWVEEGPLAYTSLHTLVRARLGPLGSHPERRC